MIWVTLTVAGRGVTVLVSVTISSISTMSSLQNQWPSGHSSIDLRAGSRGLLRHSASYLCDLMWFSLSEGGEGRAEVVTAHVNASSSEVFQIMATVRMKIARGKRINKRNPTKEEKKENSIPTAAGCPHIAYGMIGRLKPKGRSSGASTKASISRDLGSVFIGPGEKK